MVAVKRGHLELVRYLLQYSVVKTSVPMINKVCNACLTSPTLCKERNVTMQTSSCHHSCDQ